jgi:beta-lactamase regulating signal transducer with metallopeptidase domain
MLETFFFRYLTLSLTGSAVLLPLLLCTRFLRSRYAARTCYFVWLVLAVRLLLPFQFALPQPMVTVEAPAREIVIAPPAQETVRLAPAVSSAPVSGGTVRTEPAQKPSETPTRTVPVTGLATALWMAGAAAFLGAQWGGYWIGRRRLLRSARPAGQPERAVLLQLGGKLGIPRLPRLCRCRGVSTPMLLGLLRPVILLPERASGGAEETLMLRHELLHLRRHDLAYKLLLLLVNGIHWFNPLVWWMGREASRNLELCCDDDAVRGADAEFRRLYGAVLIQTAGAQGGPALSTRFGGEKKQLKGRLKNLFQKKRQSAVLVCLILAAALLAGSLVGCQAQTLTPEEALDALKASITYEDGALSFTIPEGIGPAEEWNIHIAGRAETAELGGMSLHYFEGEAWQAGKTYTLEMTLEQWAYITQLSMDAQPPYRKTGGSTAMGWQITVDLLAYVRGGAAADGDPAAEADPVYIRYPETEIPLSQVDFAACQSELSTEDWQALSAFFPVLKEGHVLFAALMPEAGAATAMMKAQSIHDIFADYGFEHPPEEFTLSSYALCDLTGDGEKELALYSNHDSGLNLVLHREGDAFYGVYKPIRWFMDLQENGIFYGSGGAATSYYKRLHFKNGAAWVELLANTDWDYYAVGGEEVTQAEFEAWQAEALVGETAWYVARSVGGAAYTNTAYGFTVRFPDSWAGRIEVAEDSDANLMTIYQSASRQADDPTAGVLANLCVCTQSVFDEVYGDKDLDGMYENGGPRITVLGHVGEYLVYLHVDRLPEDVTGLTAAYVRMRREAEQITADAFNNTGAAQAARYISSLYGFTMDLPADWVGQVEVQEYLGLPTFVMKDAGDWGGMLLDVTWMPSEEFDPDHAPVPEYFLAEQDGITLYAYPATDVQFDPEKDQERYRALESGIGTLLESFQLQEATAWPKVAGYGILTTADSASITLDMVEQQSWYQFNNPVRDETALSVSTAAVAGVEEIEYANNRQITYSTLLSDLEQYAGKVFQIYTVDGVVVCLNQWTEAIVLE